jgi:hypothetical protein
MMKTISLIKILPVIFLIASVAKINAQDDFYDINTIQQIEISFTQSNWDYMMDTAKAGSGSYLMAQWVKINGVQFDSAGVKYKGTSSYDPSYIKNPLHISLDEFINQSYQGFTSIKLANFYGDPSMIREPLAYSFLSNYMDCSRSNFANVTINGNLIGLYSNDESINKKFCSTHFYSSGNTFIKGNPEVAGPYSKANLKYISADSSDYFSKYGIESDYGWTDLVDLCYVLKYDIGSIESVVDIDRALWMLAFNDVLVNLDSYSGWFSQNHYLYKDNTGHYNPVVWDLNMSFGGFPFAGSQGGGSGSLTVEQMQQLPLFLHFTDNDWPLIYDILSNPEWRRMYLAHLRTIVNQGFYNGIYLSRASLIQTLIAEAVQSDPNKFFTYEQFVNGMTENCQFGSYVVPGIAVLMEERVDYLLSTPELSAIPPIISDVMPGNPEPILNDEVDVTAMVTGDGQNNVYLGFRHDKEEKFVREIMYDDGNHNDGESGDQVYGASFIMSSLIADYYIYAENADAGMFSPEQAGHIFYTLTADIPAASPGDVVINEFLAKNNLDTVNEYGNHEDWIELYNLTEEPLDLFGLYLSDDYTDPVKYAFPENSIIQPGSYLMIWADEEDTVSSWLHANFKLSANGESLMLSDGAGLVLDSLTFGAQTADISLGRCPNGTGPFSDLIMPTFNNDNYCPDYISDKDVTKPPFIVMPDPFLDHFVLMSDIQGIISAEMYSISGSKVAEEKVESGLARFDALNLPSGIYFIIIKNDKNEVLGSGKIVKLK